MSRTRSKADRELEAMAAILGALEGLEGESIQRVLDYVLGRLSIARPSRPSSMSAPNTVALVDAGKGVRQASIRDLKEEKQPATSNQMAAIVAYYLSELAPAGERREEISSADLERYFKQAGFKLPQAIYKTLRNAAAAGYFDATGAGRYRLNPVGYNLVVHGLPRGPEAQKTTRAKSVTKTKKKKKKARR